MTIESSFPLWVDYLARAGHLAPSADNSQPWRFHWHANSGTLCVTRVNEGLGANHPATLMALGTVLENIAYAATTAKMDLAQWRFITPYQGQLDVLHIPQPHFDFATPPPLPLSILQRHTNRNPFTKSTLSAEVIHQINSSAEQNVKALVINERHDIDKVARLISLASEARFQTEEIHHWFAQSLRFSEADAAHGDGLDVATLALPPGGKLLLQMTQDWSRMSFLNRLGLHKFFAKVEGTGLNKCGAVIAFMGDVSSLQDWLSAGRLIQRVWLKLTEANLAVQPYFVLTDQLHRFSTNQIPHQLRPHVEEIKKQVVSSQLIGKQPLLMLMRVGQSRRAAVRSQRLPLHSVLSFNP